MKMNCNGVWHLELGGKAQVSLQLNVLDNFKRLSKIGL